MWHLCFSNNTLSDGHNQPRFTLLNVFTFKLIQSVLLWKSFFGDYSREFKATFPNQCFAWPNPVFRTLSTETRSQPWWWSSFPRPCRPATTSPTTWPAPWSSPRTSPSPPQPSGPGSVSFPLQILYLHKQANLAFREFSCKFNIQRICLLGVLYSEMDFIINWIFETYFQKKLKILLFQILHSIEVLFDHSLTHFHVIKKKKYLIKENDMRKYCIRKGSITFIWFFQIRTTNPHRISPSWAHPGQQVRDGN